MDIKYTYKIYPKVSFSPIEYLLKYLQYIIPNDFI